MARVAFFVESLPPTDDLIGRFAFALARSLAEQQHEILIFSTQTPGHPGPPPTSHLAGGLAIATPFRNWGWVEAARAMPALMRFRPDVLHFVQPHAAVLEGWTSAVTALAAAAPALGLPVVAASFFDLRGAWRTRHRALLLSCHAMTAANTRQLDAIRAECGNARPLLATVPLGMIDDDAARFDEPNAALSELMAHADRKLLLVPGDVDAHTDPQRLFKIIAHVLKARPRAAVAITGGWGSVAPTARFRLLSSLGDDAGARFALLCANGSTRGAIMRQTSAIFGATLGLETLVFAEAARDAIKQNLLFVATREQAIAEPQASAILRIAEDREEALVDAALAALDSDPTLSERAIPAAERARRELNDDPANVISRLYAQAITDRRRSQRERSYFSK